MVCQRCIRAVQNRLDALDISFKNIELGKITLHSPLSAIEKEKLSSILEKDGFALLADKSSKLIEQVKNLIIEVIHYDKNILQINFSDYISKELKTEYNYLSRLFSSVEGVTIEKYIIHQRIERIKELLIYDELSPTEISYKLNYSSLQHMSNQFKKQTGLSPRAFKNLKKQDRKPLDEV